MRTERKISETFEFKNKKLQVVECADINCEECYFYEHNISCTPINVSNFIGPCLADDRKDNKDIIFVEIK